MDSNKKPESQKSRMKKLANKMTNVKYSLFDPLASKKRVKYKGIQRFKNEVNNDYRFLNMVEETVSASTVNLGKEIHLLTMFEN